MPPIDFSDPCDPDRHSNPTVPSISKFRIVAFPAQERSAVSFVYVMIACDTSKTKNALGMLPNVIVDQSPKHTVYPLNGHRFDSHSRKVGISTCRCSYEGLETPEGILAAHQFTILSLAVSESRDLRQCPTRSMAMTPFHRQIAVHIPRFTLWPNTCTQCGARFHQSVGIKHEPGRKSSLVTACRCPHAHFH